MATGISQVAFIATSSSHPTTGGVLSRFPAEKDSQAGIWSNSFSLNTGTKTLFSSPATFSLSPASVFYLQHLSVLQILWQASCSSCVKKNLVLVSMLSTNFSSNSSSLPL